MSKVMTLLIFSFIFLMTLTFSSPLQAEEKSRKRSRIDLQEMVVIESRPEVDDSDSQPPQIEEVEIAQPEEKQGSESELPQPEIEEIAETGPKKPVDEPDSQPFLAQEERLSKEEQEKAAEKIADSPVMELEKTVVTESEIDRALQEAPASITIITKEDIEVSGARTVDQLIQSAVGVNVLKPQGLFGPASQVRLRGFSNSRAAVFLLDGMPINRIVSGGVLFNEIPVDLIERVEIVRGINSSIYGTGAMGGVVNIVTKKPEKGISAFVDGSYGTYNTWTTDAFVSAQLHDKLNSQINYNHFDSDGYFAWSDSWIEDRVIAMTQNLDSWENVADNYLQSLEKQTRTTDNVFAKLKYDITPSSTLDLGGSYWKTENDIGYKYGYINQERKRINIDFKRKGALETTANLFYLTEYMEFSKPVLPTPDMDDEQAEQTWLVQGNKNDIPLNDYGGMLSVSFDLGQRHRLTLGTEHRIGDVENEFYDGLTSERISIYQGKQYRAGSFIQDEITLGKLSAFLGLRYDHVKTYDLFYEDRFTYEPYDFDTLTDDQFNPKIGLLYKLNDSTILRASVGRASTFPPLMYLIGDYECPPGRTVIGNPRLETEHSIGYEAGIEHYFLDKISTKLTGFYNDIDNWMQEVAANDPVYSSVSVRWENIEKARNYGVEAEVEYFPVSSLKLYANYNYIYTEIERFDDKYHNYNNKQLEGNRFPLQPSNRFNFGLTYSNPNIATTNFTFRYVGKRYWDIENTVELDAYVTCDIKIIRDLTKSITASLEINDIFDEAWQDDEMHVTPGRMIFGRIKFKY